MLIGHSYVYILCTNIYSSLLSIFNWVAFLVLSYKSSLYILDTRPISDIWFENSYSHYMGYLFIFFFYIIQKNWGPHHVACRISVSWPEVEPRPRQWKHQILTTRSPGNSHPFHILDSVLWWQKVFTLIKAKFMFFSFVLVLFVSYLRIHCQ